MAGAVPSDMKFYAHVRKEIMHVERMDYKNLALRNQFDGYKMP